MLAEVDRVPGKIKKSRIRWVMLAMLFMLTMINFADRSVISITGPVIAKDLKLDVVSMGYIFSAWGWAYVAGQLPGGWILDRFGSKKVYALSLFTWSLFTFLGGFVYLVNSVAAVAVIFGLRFLVGVCESPALVANARIVAAWFPTSERGTAASLFNSATYFATVVFAPVTGWITQTYGWTYAFASLGLLGIALSLVWLKVYYAPKDHPSVSQAELDYIEQGGALVNMDQSNRESKNSNNTSTLFWIKQMLQSRMLVGIFIAQYCFSALTFFFLTWFPVYLVQARGMSVLKVGFVVALPALSGFIGGILGGVFSDYLLKKGYSLSVARKVPIILGMLLCVSMIACNYTNVEWLVVALMTLSFFGKGFGALGWAVISDTSPKEIVGVSGGLFNMIGSAGSITTPIIIGYIVKATGSFNGALMFVVSNAILNLLCYLVIIGKIERVELKKS